MSKVISIYFISGGIFQKIFYNNIYELDEKLKLLIIYYDSNLLIQLLINKKKLNNFNIIDTSELLKVNKYTYITIMFIQKKELYCLGNENGKYILDHKNDNYSKLLCLIITYSGNNSYNIIKNNSYKNLIIVAIKYTLIALEFISIYLKYDKYFIFEIVKYDGRCLEFANINLQNDKIIVYEAVKQNGYALEFASITLQNNKRIVYKAIGNNGKALFYASIDLRNDKNIVSKAVRNNGEALEYASINLKNNRKTVYKAVKQYGCALKFASIELKNDKYIVYEAVKNNKQALLYAGITLQK